MTQSLFGNNDSPASTDSLFPNTDTSSSSYDVESIMQQLMAQTGCSAEEAGAAVLRQLSNRSQAKAVPEQSYFSLRTQAEKAEYMRRIRESASQNVWIPEQWKTIEQGDIEVAQAQAQFTQNMKNKAKNTNASVIEQMRAIREKK